MNLGALGLKLDVVDSVADCDSVGKVVAAPRVSSPWLIDPLQILMWCFPWHVWQRLVI